MLERFDQVSGQAVSYVRSPRVVPLGSACGGAVFLCVGQVFVGVLVGLHVLHVPIPLLPLLHGVRNGDQFSFAWESEFSRATASAQSGVMEIQKPPIVLMDGPVCKLRWTLGLTLRPPFQVFCKS